MNHRTMKRITSVYMEAGRIGVGVQRRRYLQSKLLGYTAAGYRFVWSSACSATPYKKLAHICTQHHANNNIWNRQESEKLPLPAYQYRRAKDLLKGSIPWSCGRG